MPKRANNEGSIRQRPDGRWEGRFTVGIDPATGKQKRRSIYGDTQAEVRKAMTKLIKSLDDGTYQEPQKITLASWLDEWLSVYCHGLKPLTQSTYAVAIKKHIKPALGGLKLQDIRGGHIQKFYNDMQDAGFSPKTISNVGGIINKALEDARKEGLVAANACQNATLPKRVKKEITPLSDAEIPLFLDAIENDPLKNAFAVALFAGLREGELLGLSWDNVDFEKHTLHIAQQLQKEKSRNARYYILPTTKSGKDRTIMPPDICFEYLHAEKVKQLENRFAAGQAWSNPDNLVFTDPLGTHLTFLTFYKHFKRAATSIGRPDARPHDLRHTCCTSAIASGSDLKSVQDFMGHATASFTLSTYAHVSEKMKEDMAARMQNYYDSLKRQA